MHIHTYVYSYIYMYIDVPFHWMTQGKVTHDHMQI